MDACARNSFKGAGQLGTGLADKRVAKGPHLCGLRIRPQIRRRDPGPQVVEEDVVSESVQPCARLGSALALWLADTVTVPTRGVERNRFAQCSIGILDLGDLFLRDRR